MRWTVLVVLLSGCAGAAAFRALPETDVRAWNACYSMVRGRNCPTSGDAASGVYASVCMDDVGGQFSALPSPDERRRFLVEAGCPSSVVERVYGGGR